ncbi:Hsp20/alpha crystallin family protein [Halopiger aswanensis]|uniref:HSP20 family molecular chaperone IbpA n=1 Tax=Halopiger aswanensis TaxID=148449 RepID=A0A3R7FVB6_9EURY|nr:Hsp20/alpha crystallin family protein [Halopiger aswanensis]RKD94861.1 HSP20 family molecular chaperone IbpA [Halopiger aswanensis]
MTENPSDDRDRDRDRDPDRDASRDDHWLTSLLDALLSLEDDRKGTGEGDGDDEYRSSGRRRGDRSVIDYDVSIRSGEDLLDDARRSGERAPFGRDRNRERPSRRDDGRAGPTGRRYSSSVPSSDHHVTTRAYDDELLVTADVAGVDPDEVTVGFDGSTLVIGVSDHELERVDVPWDERRARATIKNGVLAVQIVPKSASESESGSEDDESETGGEDE